MPFASPHISVEDWNSGRYNDIDIFEDQMRTWLFEQARLLAPNQHSGPAILALVTPYFESIECYKSGKSSKGNETAFLRKGLAQVFPSLSSEVCEQYITEVRHGFAHEAIFRRVALHHSHPDFPTFGIHNGILFVDPWWVLACTEQHFDRYVLALRDGQYPELLQSFNSFMQIRKQR
ncbi:MAG: hypothetical protein HY799_12830 [Nitrosomonadales bacterium]|nr:hypothetical protein [Nitrosomonadales bacterium]